MRKIRLTLLSFLLIPTLLSCDRENQTQYHGYLYFAQSHYLMRLSLRDGNLSVVTNLGDKSIRDVSMFLENRLLIAESTSINRKNVRRISWVDVNSGQSAALYAGVLARYLEGSGFIVYDDAVSLFAVKLASDAGNETIFTHKMNQLSTILVISEDTVLFETKEAGDWRIRSYNVLTKTLRTLDRLSGICRLEQAVWIDDLEKLACKKLANETENATYVLSDLDGDVSSTLPLPEGKHFVALTYISGQNALILKEHWNDTFGGQERAAIWVYNVESKESQRLAKSQNPGSSVVYMSF